MIFIYTTFPNKKTAERIGEGLIQKRMAGCCNIFPITAVYSWQGKIAQGKEFVVIIKTKKENFKKIEKFILKNHPDDTPCILEMPINRITAKYSKWLNKYLR